MVISIFNQPQFKRSLRKMKKLLPLFAMALLITACKPKATTDATAAKTDTAGFAYTIPEPTNNWDIDTNTTNLKVALKALKAYETGDTTNMRSYFTDTITFNFDSGTFKGPAGDFVKQCKMATDSGKKVVIQMSDWESVISKKEKDQWVGLWYDEISTDAKGKVDTLSEVNNVLFANGKITRIDEYVRRLKK